MFFFFYAAHIYVPRLHELAQRKLYTIDSLQFFNEKPTSVEHLIMQSESYAQNSAASKGLSPL